MASDRQMDWAPYFEGLAQRRLLIQKCAGCGRFRFPPIPICGACRSRDWQSVPARGTGRVRSYVIMRRPVMALPASPVVAVVELDEGVMVVSSIVDADEDQVDFDMEVRLTFVETGDGRVIHAFEPAAR